VEYEVGTVETHGSRRCKWGEKVGRAEGDGRGSGGGEGGRRLSRIERGRGVGAYTFIRDALPSVHLQDPGAAVLEEISVVGDGHNWVHERGEGRDDGGERE
jgi:hypothetical protein